MIINATFQKCTDCAEETQSKYKILHIYFFFFSEKEKMLRKNEGGGAAGNTQMQGAICSIVQNCRGAILHK